MANILSDFAELDRSFADMGIPTTAPGFYDHPSFRTREERNPNFLNHYAAFVQKRPYDAKYLSRARSLIEAVAEFMHKELVQEGRLRACIDTSMVMSRILDREGIWNYMVKGALTTSFPESSGIPQLYLWPVDVGEFQAGHVWIVAPPFEIVDITLKLQPYSYDVDQYMPDYVLAEEGRRSKATETDIFSPEARAEYMARGVPEGFLILRVLPYLGQFSQVFPTLETTVASVDLKYVATGISASDGPLEEITSLQLSGRSGIQLYEDVIKPAIH